MRNQLGIDLGAGTLTVSARGEGIVLQEPSFVALGRDDRQNVAVGQAAKDLLEAHAARHYAVRPFKNGICSGAYTAPVLAHLLKKTGCDAHNRLLIGVPCKHAEAQDAALIELAAQAGAEECYLVYTPIAAAVGDGLDFSRSRCLLEIGAARTNFMVVGNGRSLYRETVGVAGNDFDAAIMEYMKAQYDMKISASTAEQVKRRIACVWEGKERMSVEIAGVSLTNGASVEQRVWSDDLIIAFEEPMRAILNLIYRGLTRLPTESVNHVLEDGIFMYGGGACLRGMKQMIESITHVDVMDRSAGAERCVAAGLGKILARLPDALGMPVGNISSDCVRMYTPARF